MPYGKKRWRSRKGRRSGRKRRRSFRRKRSTVRTVARRVDKLAKTVFSSRELKVVEGTRARTMIGSSWASTATFFSLLAVDSATTAAQIAGNVASDTIYYRVGSSIYVHKVVVKLRFDNGDSSLTGFSYPNIRVFVMRYSKMDGATPLTSVQTFFQDTSVNSFYEQSEMREKSFRRIKDFMVRFKDVNPVLESQKHIMFTIPVRRKVSFSGQSGFTIVDNPIYMQMCSDLSSYGAVSVKYQVYYSDC